MRTPLLCLTLLCQPLFANTVLAQALRANAPTSIDRYQLIDLGAASTGSKLRTQAVAPATCETAPLVTQRIQ